MLRIISLTKDPVCLTRFLQDQVLPGSVPQADWSSPARNSFRFFPS